MENKNNGSGIFLGVIGVATLIVAIIGATFAFFGANASSSEGAVTAESAVLQLGYADDTTKLKTNLIPASSLIAEYAATNAEHVAAKGECIDDNGNEVCGIYTFTIGNPSFTTQQTLYGNIKVVSNDFENLYFKIFDELGNAVVPETAFSTAGEGGIIPLNQLTQALLPSSSDDGKTPEEDSDSFTATKPTTYTKINDKSDAANSSKLSNVRTYKMLIWIKETNNNQTDVDSGKTFAASVNFTTASDTNGVTGVIAAAQNPAGSE